MGNPAVYPNEGRDIFVADVLAYAAFPRFHLLAPLGDSIYRRITGNEWESTVYLGFVNLACCGLPTTAVARRQNAWLITYVLAGMATFCIIASGNCFTCSGIGSFQCRTSCSHTCRSSATCGLHPAQLCSSICFWLSASVKPAPWHGNIGHDL